MALSANKLHNHKKKTNGSSTHEMRLDLKETAQYISDMVLEMRNLAKAVELKKLQELLELTFYEAFSAANRVEIPPEEIEHLRELSGAIVG